MQAHPDTATVLLRSREDPARADQTARGAGEEARRASNQVRDTQWNIPRYLNLSDAAPRLQQAVEALKPKVTVTDKKTSFWNAYKTLADEQDKELQQKYSSDLDTALIFVRTRHHNRYYI
jgi:hypothetical protein